MFIVLFGLDLRPCRLPHGSRIKGNRTGLGSIAFNRSGKNEQLEGNKEFIQSAKSHLLQEISMALMIRPNANVYF